MAKLFSQTNWQNDNRTRSETNWFYRYFKRIIKKAKLTIEINFSDNNTNNNNRKRDRKKNSPNIANLSTPSKYIQNTWYVCVIPHRPFTASTFSEGKKDRYPLGKLKPFCRSPLMLCTTAACVSPNRSAKVYIPLFLSVSVYILQILYSYLQWGFLRGGGIYVLNSMIWMWSDMNCE